MSKLNSQGPSKKTTGSKMTLLLECQPSASTRSCVNWNFFVFKMPLLIHLSTIKIKFQLGFLW